MLTIGYFSKFPAAYRDREASVKDVIFGNISAIKSEEDDIILVESTCGKYKQEIEIHDKNIHLNSQCRVSCTCESFNFEFANSIFKNNSLLNTMKFVKSVTNRPKKTNQFNIASGCKHIVALSRKIIRMKLT